MKLIGLVLLCISKLISAQDYQEYEPEPPRVAPHRLGLGSSPAVQKPTPIPILKQINRHNEDGSYTYGYEGADGSFKIETKLATGEVMGKYGYTDETGKVRVVEYGANKYGFQPSGEGITVPPPTTVDETTNKNGNRLSDYEDEPQQPQKSYNARVSRPRPAPRPTPQYEEYEDEPIPVRSQPQYIPQYVPEPRPQPQYVTEQRAPSQFEFRPQQFDPEPRPQPQYLVEARQQPKQQLPGPVPPRVQISGAQPNDILYSPQSRPARPDAEYSQIQSFGSSSHQHQNVRISRPVFQPAVLPVARSHQPDTSPVKPVSEQPQYHQPVPSTPQHFRAPQGRSTSVLDQLAKDYALPQNGANPLHDITFGYY